ncbi:unnamed protein product [Candida parapsilosis]
MAEEFHNEFEETTTEDSFMNPTQVSSEFGI